MLAKQLIVTTIPIYGVTHKVVGDMVEMFANLMITAGLRPYLNKRIAGAGVSSNRYGQLVGCKPKIGGSGLAGWPGAVFGKGMVNQALFSRVAAGYRKIGFLNLMLSKQTGKTAR